MRKRRGELTEEEKKEILERARASAKEMAEAEITLEMEDLMGETFEEKCKQAKISEDSPARAVIRAEYVEEARARIARAKEESEEARKVDSKKPPGTPSAEEWRQHRLTHWPYRSWCPVCVAARAVEDAHRLRGPMSDADGPEIHWDYCFLRNRPGEANIPVLVGKDRKTRCFVAHVVPGKGAKSDWIAVQLARDIRKMGYFGRVVLRSDGEPAIRDLMSELARARADAETAIENTAPGDSRANGYAERAVRSVEEMIRAIKIGYEQNTGKEVDIKSAGMDWIVEHAVDILNKCVVGHDGKTAYENIKMKKYHGQYYEFGDSVLSKVPGKPEGGRMQPRWIAGIWLGKRWGSDEHIVSLPGGRVARARNVKPSASGFDRDLFDGLIGRPCDPTGSWDGAGELPQGVAPAMGRVPSGRPDPPVEPTKVRATPIQRRFLEKYGFTEGCSKCRAIERKDDSQPTLAHNAACRARIEELLKKDPEHKDKIAAQEERRDRFVEQEIERGEKRAQEPEDKDSSDQARKKQKPLDVQEEDELQEADEEEEGEEGVEDEDEEDQPEKKRQRVMTYLTVGIDRQILNSLVLGLATRTESNKDVEKIHGIGKSIRSTMVDLLVSGSEDGRLAEVLEEMSGCGRDGSGTDGLSATDETARSGGREPQDDMRSPLEVETELLRVTRSNSAFDVCEVFSPPRVVEAARKMRNMRGGWSLDLSAECPVTRRAWDFRLESDRKRARAMVLKDRPGLLILSPPCTLFSLLQNLHPDGLPEKRDPIAWREAILFVEFAMELAEVQRRAGRSFVFEHPQAATSWKLSCVEEMMSKEGVGEAVFDMCRYGMVARDELGEGAVRKTTRLMTNDPGIISLIHGVRCDGGHRHVQLVGGRAAAAAIYPEDLCRSLLRGHDVTRKSLSTMALMSSTMGLEESEDLCDPGDNVVKAEAGQYWDDLKGEVLDPGLARKARMEEIEVFKMRDVYEIVPRSSIPRGKRVIGVRWVETNKGTSSHPKVRSRLVAQEFARGKTPEDMYAPTPSLLATRWLVSEAASQGAHGPGSVRLMALDFKRAFLYGICERELYVEVPLEDDRIRGRDVVGRLKKSMYGTQDAPAVWQRVVNTMLRDRGFVASRTLACVYFNRETGLKVVAHVDDFLVVGEKKQCEELLKDLKKDFEVDGDIVGLQPGEVSEVKFLGRTLRATPQGMEIEADRRLAIKIIEEASLGGGKGVDHPGGVVESKGGPEIALDPAESTLYRRGVAIINFLAQDRGDLSYASKELSRRMSSPISTDLPALKRVARYLRSHPTWVALYKWQEKTSVVSIYTDSDWGGCERTRKSTTGGVAMKGLHCIAHWSRTQQLVALSSAEAELNASVRAGQEGLGIMHFSMELGTPHAAEVLGDASAAHGINMRVGSGRVKHLSIRQLWLQERVALGHIVCKKIPREVNCADAMTHHWTPKEGRVHFEIMHCYTRGPTVQELESWTRGGVKAEHGRRTHDAESIVHDV